MPLPKQRANESDSDFAVRLEKSRQAAREYRETNKEALKEKRRRYYEANREAIGERRRRYYEANKEANKEARRKRDRRCREAKILAQAKGKPLQNNFHRAQRPRMLSRLIRQEAKNFCLEWGFEMERSVDNDVLRQAARNIRDSAELSGEPNPWYGTDFLHESVITQESWPRGFRRHLPE